MVRNMLTCLLVVALTGQAATAASVGFVGFFNQDTVGGGTGFLGSVVPPNAPVAFGAMAPNPNMYQFAEGPGTQLLTGGSGILPLSAGGPLFILSGSATFIDNGASDTATFVFNVGTTAGGPANGSLNFSFSNSDLFSGGSVVSQANIDELVNGTAYLSDIGSATYVDNSTGTLNIYGGLVNAVPEPGSVAALLGLGVASVVRRRRRS